MGFSFFGAKSLNENGNSLPIFWTSVAVLPVVL